MVQSQGEEQDWILDIIADYLASPVWKNPIIEFIDENCIIFEDSEENRLEYTEIHMKFKKLVESKLEAYIQDLGINQQVFVATCSKAAKKLHKSILQQILACDDFLLFKQLMVNRNIAMNKEAMEEMKKKGKKVDRVQNQVQQAASSVEDEEAMIAKAIEESKAAFVSARLF